ncbi:MAG: hypothetical protein IPN49_09450 [Saprospiraceae bacterium]|nr:hypothetical protein [Saprospiraceae bacterium]
MMTRILVTSFLMITLFFKADCQTNEVPKIKLKYGIIAKTYPDSIVLRWAPDDANALPAHIESGVWIERLKVTGKRPYQVSKWEKLTANPITPAALEAFNNEASKKNEYEMLVAQLMYGNLPQTVSKSEIEDVKDKASMTKSLFSITLLGCDYSASAATKMGLRYTIKEKIKEEEKIFFRIYSAFNHPLFESDTTITFSTYGEWDVVTNPKYLTTTSKEKAVELSWPHNKDLYRWAGFNIEKSNDGKNFSRLNKKPFLTMTNDRNTTVYYTDSVVNYIKHYYRIEALDPFGESAGYSEIVMGYGKDLTPPSEIVLNEKDNNGQSIQLNWKFVNGKADADVKHFIVKKGNEINNIKDTLLILNKNTYTYTDNFKATTKSTYYEISAVDTSGNVSYSNPVRYFIPDKEPPKVPENFKGTIDQNGMVKLTWDTDTLDQLAGYRVYRTNQVNHDFVCLQQGYLSTNEFYDTLSLTTLTDEIYYAVCAVDISYNHSKRSAPIKLIKPDKIPPIPPQIVHYNLGDGTANIEWSHSPSNDVVSYEVTRKLLSDTTKILKKIIAKENTKFEDTGLVHGEMYEYSIVSIDKVNLVSEPCFPLTIKAYTNKSTEELKLSWLADKEITGFTWNNLRKKPIFYIVYKDIGSGLEQYKNLPPSATEFSEPDKNKHDKLRYGIQAMYENQVKSEIYILDWKSN